MGCDWKEQERLEGRSQLADCNRAREKLVIYIRTESVEEISGQNYGYILKVDSPFLLEGLKVRCKRNDDSRDLAWTTGCTRKPWRRNSLEEFRFGHVNFVEPVSSPSGSASEFS